MAESIHYGNVTICYEPMTEYSRRSEGIKWCFKCRKRRKFWWIVMVPVELSYYGPSASMICEACQTVDGDLFPGYSRETGGE